MHGHGLSSLVKFEFFFFVFFFIIFSLLRLLAAAEVTAAATCCRMLANHAISISLLVRLAWVSCCDLFFEAHHLSYFVRPFRERLEPPVRTELLVLW